MQGFIDDTAALAWCAEHEVVVYVETVPDTMDPYIVTLWITDLSDRELSATFRVVAFREAVERFILVWRAWTREVL